MTARTTTRRPAGDRLLVPDPPVARRSRCSPQWPAPDAHAPAADRAAGRPDRPEDNGTGP